MKFWLLVFLAALSMGGQETSPESKSSSATEEKELNKALAEAGNSQIDFVRALETHLAKYPNTSKRPEIERALVKAAIEAKDDRRIILYGEWVLDHENGDPQILDRVTRALLASDAKDTAERALGYAKRYEDQVAAFRKQPPAGHMSGGEWRMEADRSIARTLVLQARATGNLGKMDEALKLAEKSYGQFPTAEGAREIARWLMKLGREPEAIPHLADAFTIPDNRNSEDMRAQDRSRMGQLYTKLYGSQKGLGDLILQSYDRSTALLAERKLQMQSSDPNGQAAGVMDFTLPAVQGDALKLASLKGKTLVFDFWATWCGPCRVQHPLYEQVKQHFAQNPDVIFISVDSDEDRDLVAPFLKDHQWNNTVFFEDGLSRVLQITSIPTTIVVDRRGEVASRMNGFNPEHFVELLTERIEQTLKN